MIKTPVEVFSDWVHLGKDVGMESAHLPAVENMLDYAIEDLKNFSFIDAGCGNGWVVRKAAQLSECKSVVGIDGSQTMINKAITLDQENEYVCDDLLNWIPEEKVALVHSMEVFYYFEEPEKLIHHVFNHWLTSDSRLIIGLDFYTENEESHSWPEKCGISIMQLYAEDTWKAFFRNAGFQDVQSWRVGEKKDWAGTLIVTGAKTTHEDRLVQLMSKRGASYEQLRGLG